MYAFAIALPINDASPPSTIIANRRIGKSQRIRGRRHQADFPFAFEASPAISNIDAIAARIVSFWYDKMHLLKNKSKSELGVVAAHSPIAIRGDAVSSSAMNNENFPHNQPSAATQHENPVALLRSLFPVGCRRYPYHNVNRDSNDYDDEGYTSETVRAIRCGDVATLRKLKDEEGATFEACNRNGETLLHLACRRGNLETIKFLVHEAGASLDVRDDLGRTVLHDLCWRPAVDLGLMDAVIRLIPPKLLLAEDLRGHTPFDYVRRGDWPQWTKFLQSKQDLIKLRVALSCSP